MLIRSTTEIQAGRVTLADVSAALQVISITLAGSGIILDVAGYKEAAHYAYALSVITGVVVALPLAAADFVLTGGVKYLLGELLAFSWQKLSFSTFRRLVAQIALTPGTKELLKNFTRPAYVCIFNGGNLAEARQIANLIALALKAVEEGLI